MENIRIINKITFDNAFFIKLGERGEWEKKCIQDDQILKFGYRNPYHEDCLNGNWDIIRQYWNEQKTKGKATEIVNQTRIFYESSENTLWVTFFLRKLFWCFTEKNVIKMSDGYRIRKVKGKWSCCDIQGNPLTIEDLSGKFSKVQGFRGTICSIHEKDYLIRKLNHQKLPEIEKAEATLETLSIDVEPLIRNLSWKDFELLVDLIFSNAGWQRISTLGKTEKDIDLKLISPVTGNCAFVQIKSKADMKTFNEYVKKYTTEKDQFHEMYFIVHSPDDSLNSWQDTDDIKLWNCKKLSKLVINSGLINWLITKTS